ncbi:MAG TPA: hypothetical protein VMF07_14765 [Solirubrobacteraceae bacterium]|nr:hypothetical protein [Solirubrobacteraceae bacterium]
MDAIEPILSNPSILPEVRAATRTDPIHRDGQRGGGRQGNQGSRRNDEDAVEVDVDGIDDSDLADAADEPLAALPAPAPRLIDLTADGDPEPPARRVDLIDDDEAEAPSRRIDLSA